MHMLSVCVVNYTNDMTCFSFLTPPSLYLQKGKKRLFTHQTTSWKTIEVNPFNLIDPSSNVINIYLLISSKNKINSPSSKTKWRMMIASEEESNDVEEIFFISINCFPYQSIFLYLFIHFLSRKHSCQYHSTKCFKKRKKRIGMMILYKILLLLIMRLVMNLHLLFKSLFRLHLFHKFLLSLQQWNLHHAQPSLLSLMNTWLNTLCHHLLFHLCRSKPHQFKSISITSNKPWNKTFPLLRMKSNPFKCLSWRFIIL